MRRLALVEQEEPAGPPPRVALDARDVELVRTSTAKTLDGVRVRARRRVRCDTTQTLTQLCQGC